MPGGFSSRIAALARRPSGSVADFSDIGVHTCLCLRFIRRRMGKEGDSWPNSDKKPSWLFLRALGRNDRAFFRSPRGSHRSSGRRGIVWDRPMHGRNRCAQPRFAHKKRGEEVLSETSDLGPDFIAGVTMAEIPDGGVKAGHVGGKSALLARSGNEVFAIGATCSHLGGPLHQGLIVGHTIRCPWHHACFSLRSGMAVAAPAFDPLFRWEVAVEGNVVRVKSAIDLPAPSRLPRNGDSSH
jgi:nitrite reductase/ring-hydroxylating ferredoxin subunit